MKCLSLLLICSFGCYEVVRSYQIGVGRADCTGPPVEIVFVSLPFIFLFISVDRLSYRIFNFVKLFEKGKRKKKMNRNNVTNAV